MQNMDKFRERLAELMLNEDLTTDKLGEKIGVDGSAVRLWKLGNSVFLSNAIKLADFFKCSVDFLFGRSEKLIDFTSHSSITFYNGLRKVMNIKQISTYRICKELKISRSSLTNWKRGADPFMQTVILICDYLDVSIDYLVGRDR